jgi:hypothetical protein
MNKSPSWEANTYSSSQEIFNILNLRLYNLVVVRSKARMVLNPSNTGILGSNPTRGMDVCPRFSVLCCPVCR